MTRHGASFDEMLFGMLVVAAALIWLLWIPCEVLAGLLR